jgi:uncharacterized phage-associated protein
MGPMTISAHLAAEEIRKRIPGVGNVKIHKLLYYAQGHHLAAFGEPLFDDTISAWDMGPVVGSLWHAERNEHEQFDFDEAAADEAALNTIGYIVSRYGGLTAQDLIRLSHGEPPWQIANAQRQPGTSVRIPTESIREYFAVVADEDEETGPPVDAELLHDVLSGAPERLRRDVRTDTADAIAARISALTG